MHGETVKELPVLRHSHLCHTRLTSLLDWQRPLSVANLFSFKSLHTPLATYYIDRPYVTGAGKPNKQLY